MAQYAHYIEARIKGTLHGSQTINVIHFGTNEAAATPDLLVQLLGTLAGHVVECVVAALLGAVTSEWHFDGVDAKQIGPEISDPIEVQSAPGDDVGLRQGCNASFESILLRKQTGGGGKSGRGRAFLPPPGDGDMAQSLLTAGDAANFYAQFITCLKGKFMNPNPSTPFRMLVYSRTKKKAAGGTFDTATREVTQLGIETRIKSLNSRKLGHGG